MKGLFIGLTTIDIQYIVDKFPETNIKTKSEPPKIFVGGPATNAAIAFAKLSGNACLVSSVGRNPFTEFIVKDFNVTNVKHIDLSGSKELNPVLATVVTSAENGHRNIFTHHPESINPTISPEKLIEIEQPQIVMLDGFYPEFSIKCAELARQKNIPVVLDCGSWKPQFEEILDFTNIVIASADFFPPGCKNETQVISYLQAKNVLKIAISKGEYNIVFSENGKRGEVTIDKIKVLDTLGAGDFLHGAFCYFFSQARDFKNSLLKASQVASFSCKFYGTRQWLNFTL